MTYTYTSKNKYHPSDLKNEIITEYIQDDKTKVGKLGAVMYRAAVFAYPTLAGIAGGIHDELTQSFTPLGVALATHPGPVISGFNYVVGRARKKILTYIHSNPRAYEDYIKSKAHSNSKTNIREIEKRDFESQEPRSRPVKNNLEVGLRTEIIGGLGYGIGRLGTSITLQTIKYLT